MTEGLASGDNGEPISVTVDARGTLCPIPIIWLADRVGGAPVGGLIEVLATDEAITDDLPAWCRATRHELVRLVGVSPGLWRGVVRRTHE